MLLDILCNDPRVQKRNDVWCKNFNNFVIAILVFNTITLMLVVVQYSLRTIVAKLLTVYTTSSDPEHLFQ